MQRKLLTLDDLYSFYSSRKYSTHYSAEKTGHQVVVQIDGSFSASKNEIDDSHKQGLLPVTLQSCHIGLNRNKSFISEENMNNALPSFYNRPILGNIVKIENTDEYDFQSHDMVIDEDEDKIIYIERPIGIIPESANPRLEYDKDKDKTYVVVDGYIFEDYGNQAADIIKSKDSIRVSVELAINEFSYNAKEKYLEIEDFCFLGVTCLGRRADNGEEVMEGMEGSNLKLADFDAKNNSLTVGYEEKMIEVLDKLNNTLSNFNINEETQENSKEGGNETVTKFEELLEKYSKTEADVTFEVEGLSDEELESKFAEVFGEDGTDEETEDNSTEEDNASTEEDTTGTEAASEDNGDAEDSESTEDTSVKEEEACGGKKKKKCQIEVEDKTYNFETSFDEVIYALENIVNETYSESDNAYYCVKAYDKYVVMIDYWTGRAYKQSYEVKENSYTLTGDRVEVYCQYLTADEQNALDDMRSNYDALVEFKETTTLEVSRNEKKEILSDAKFASIKESETFKKLIEDMDKYSKEELAKEAKSILVDEGTFAYSPNTTHTTVRLNTNDQDEIKKPYGNLFGNK